MGEHISTYKSSNPLIQALAICEVKNSKWRRDMEDATVFMDRYGGKEEASFFGVFDGFHGQSSATTASRELPILALEQLSKQDPSFSLEKAQGDLLSRFEGLFHRESMDARITPSSDVQQQNSTREGRAFSAAFLRMDRLLALGRNEISRTRWSGCTALVCLIDGGKDQGPGSPRGKIVIANCGNIHAVLCRQARASRLTEDHSTSNLQERKRIVQHGGSISANKQHGLVEGLGHFGDHKLKMSVIPEPYTLSLPYDPSCHLLVLASSGVWEVLDESVVNEVAKIVINRDLRLTQPRAQASPEFREDSCNVDTRDVANVKDEDGAEPRAETPEEADCENTWEIREQESSTMRGSRVNVEENLSVPPGNLPVDYEHIAADICRELVDAALASESKENISVIVILLKGLEALDENAIQKPDSVI